MTAERCAQALEESHHYDQRTVQNDRIFEKLKKWGKQESVAYSIVSVLFHDAGPVIACKFGCGPEGENLIAGNRHGCDTRQENKPDQKCSEEYCYIGMFFT